AEEQLGWNIDNKRHEYWKLPSEERTDERWKQLIKPFVELEDKFDQEHPLHKKPNPDCEDCKGSGVRQTTYNPKSKWDWWVVGGRWDGYFGRHKNITKVKNIKKI